MIGRLRRRMTLLVIGVLVLVSTGIVLSINEMNRQNIVQQAESALETLAENQGVRPVPPEARTGSLPEESSEAMEDRENLSPPPKPEGETGPGADGNSPPPKPEGETGPGEDGNSPPPRPEGETGPGEDGNSPPPRLEGEFDPGAKGDNPPPPPEDGERTRDPGAARDARNRPMSREEVASLSNSYTITLDTEGNISSWESDRPDLYSQDALQEFADQVLSGGKAGGQIDDQFYRLISQEDGTSLLIVLDARLEMLAGQRVLRTTALVAGVACLILSLGAWLLIRRMVRPVEDAFQKQQQFVWDASHELKTPLAVISANADVLEGEIGENEVLGYIKSEVRRTDSLVKNLLTLARMDRGTAEQERVEMDLSEAVLEVLLPFESTVFEAGKTLDSEGIQENVRILGNRGMLQQLTVILLSNALKYSDEGGTITVRLEKKNRGAELRVENTGKGIEKENLERIFDRFFRTDASRNSETGGEGLGLAIAKSIAEIHHGKIRAESVPGKNAVFIVNLP